jgi:hypothetical protein
MKAWAVKRKGEKVSKSAIFPTPMSAEDKRDLFNDFGAGPYETVQVEITEVPGEPTEGGSHD